MAHDINNSVLRYAGIDIPFLKTEQFLQEPVWSTDGTDLLYTHIVIGVSGVLNSCFLNDVDPACWIEANRQLLMQRGGQLYFYIGGTQVIPPPFVGSLNNDAPTTGQELVSSPAYENPYGADCGASNENTDITFSLDAKLGPKPLKLTIRHIHGGSYSIYYEIETWIPYCDGTPSPLLSNRWESTLTIDKSYFYTRTTTGVLVINGQNLEDVGAVSVLNTNALLILPPLPNNWKRETLRFTLSPDQLTLSYTIEDRQQYVAIQRPAVEIIATYSEVTPNPNSVTGIAFANVMQQNIDVTVIGDPSTVYPNSFPQFNTDDGTYYPDQLKYNLLKIMWLIVFTRIQFPFTLKGDSFTSNDTSTLGGSFITHCEMREDMFKPVVGCRIAATLTRQTTANIFNASGTFNFADDVFNATSIGLPINLIDIIAQVATQPTSIGNWATFLFIQSVSPKDPCAGVEAPVASDAYSPATTTVFSTQLVSGGGNIPTSSAYAQIVNLGFSAANSKFPFTEYKATVDWVTDNHILQLPVMYDVETDPPGTTQASAVFCQTASPTSRKIIHWRASRLNQWPLVPALNAVDIYGSGLPSDHVLKTIVSPGEVELSHDGITRQYTVAGMMEVGMARRLQWDVPNTILSTICNQVIGSSTYGDNDSSFPANSFVSGILNTGPSPGNVV